MDVTLAYVDITNANGGYFNDRTARRMATDATPRTSGITPGSRRSIPPLPVARSGAGGEAGGAVGSRGDRRGGADRAPCRLDSDPELHYVPGAPGGACVDFDLTDGSLAVSWVLGDLNPDELLLPEDIAETLQHGDRVRLTGRWAHVRLVPNDGPDDDWVSQSIRMFVVKGYEQLRA